MLARIPNKITIVKKYIFILLCYYENNIRVNGKKL